MMLRFIFFIMISFSFCQENNVTDHMGFLIGNWDYKARGYVGNGNYKDMSYQSKVHYVFDKKAIHEEFGFYKEGTQFVSLGVTVRSYDEKASKWRMIWYSTNLNAITTMIGEFKNGEFHFDGKGTEGQYQFLEKIVFYDIKKDSYKWKMDRSYDGGNNWIKNFFSYEAKKVKQ